MSEWQRVKFEDLLVGKKISYGVVQPGQFQEVGGVPLIRVNNIKNAKVDVSDIVKIHEDVEAKYSKTRLCGGELLITVVGSVGECAIVTAELKGFNVARAVSVANIVDGVDKRFVAYQFRTEDLKFQMYGNTNDTVQPTLNLTELKQLTFTLPPLSEQKAIASVLSSLDDKIDLLHRQNKTLEAMAETLFRQWFIEEAKEDWEKVTLSDYFQVKHGYAFKGEFITPEPTKCKLVTPGNFEIGGGFKSAKFKYYSSEVIPEDYVFNELDFVVTMTDLSKEGDTLGYPAFIPLHHKADVLYLHNQRVGKVQFYDAEECKFFFYMLMKQDVYQQFIVGSCTGTSVKHTSPTTIGSFTFAKPPQERMQDFDRIVGQKFAKIFANQKQIQTLENLRDTLLPKLMSGEVRVQYQTEEVA